MSQTAPSRCEPMTSKSLSASLLKSEFDIPKLDQADYLEAFIASKRQLLMSSDFNIFPEEMNRGEQGCSSLRNYSFATTITEEYLLSILESAPSLPKSETLIYRFQTKLAVFGRLVAAYDERVRKVTDDELSIDGYAAFGSVLLAYFLKSGNYNTLNSALRVSDLIERRAGAEGKLVSPVVETFFHTLLDVLEEVIDGTH